MSTDTTNGHLQIDDYQGRVFTYSSMERVLYSQFHGKSSVFTNSVALFLYESYTLLICTMCMYN